MDDNKLLQKLSQNLLDILDDDEYCDITIEVGNDPYVKIFRSHIVILNYRSSYLRRILSTNKKKNDGTLVQIKLPNISPEIFQIILRYIYGGEPSLKNYDNLDIIKIMVAASEMNLQELVIYTQSFLINYKADWMEQNFSLVYQTSFENDSFLELQKFCTDLMSKNPDKIFKSLDFFSIPEKILISLIQIDDLKMNEIKVWENVLKWGLAQNPELSSDPSNYSKDDFNSLKNTLQQCIPFIRFYNLTSKEFSDNILPYKEILPEELFTDLLRNFLNLHPDSKVNHKSKPRIAKEGTPTSTTIDDERKIENSTFSWDNRKPVSLGHIDEWRTNPKPISLNERPNPWNRSWSKVAKSNPRPTSSDEKSNPRPISSILLDDNSSRSSSWNKIANNPSPISSDGWSKPKSILLDDNSSRSSSWNKVAKSNLSPISLDGWSKPKSILLDDNNSRSSSWSKVAKSNLNPISSDDDDWFKRK